MVEALRGGDGDKPVAVVYEKHVQVVSMVPAPHDKDGEAQDVAYEENLVLETVDVQAATESEEYGAEGCDDPSDPVGHNHSLIASLFVYSTTPTTEWRTT